MKGEESQTFTRSVNDRLSMRNLARKILLQKQTQREANIALFGSAKVGKSAIAGTLGRSLYEDSEFKPELVELYEADISVTVSNAKYQHKLSIFDTIGSFRQSYPSMYRKTIEDCQAFVLVCSTKDRTSLEEVKLIYNDILDVKQQDKVPILIVANQIESEESNEEKYSKNIRNQLLSELAECPNCLYIGYTPSIGTSSLELYKSIQCLLKLALD